MIEMRPITPEDIAEIKNWPPYTNGFEQMDYALRENGWLDEFRSRQDTAIYAFEQNGALAGFSLLIMAGSEAEFRIALHPDRTGKGLGRAVAVATLARGFRQLHLAKISLIVRKNNPRASQLYAGIGFVITGESVHAIQGKDVEFIDMQMTSEQYHDRMIREGV